MGKQGDWYLPEIRKDDGMTTQDYAYRRIFNAIMLGAIPPATSLTMRGLAAYLDLSPTPVREAIRRLSSDQAVEVLDNRRIRVPQMRIGRFRELIELRIVLECHAAVRALPHLADIAIADLAAVDARMDAALGMQDYDQLTHLNHEFHRRLYLSNPDQAIMPLIESVWLQLGPFQRQVLKGVQSYYLVDHHKTILSALRDRDADRLTVAIADDIRDGIGRSGAEALEGSQDLPPAG
ncbi:GntR family transcriptional regulator [Paracoccus marinaquae]|uniref:GntR family transcriptional regulator n=1 Tax=Paracoccus marinaquae TaxID=2841926 RepID=A0ABS6AE99_9RHOB|nr:GntR family transcriptional regulator [Paracoccus marinaquae]MBU3028906.1 GntR family transcriptional regulator [Paracoccus marinaquae]